MQQGRGEEGQVLGDKTVQTLPGVVFSDGELPHGGPPECILSIIPVLWENVKEEPGMVLEFFSVVIPRVALGLLAGAACGNIHL